MKTVNTGHGASDRYILSVRDNEGNFSGVKKFPSIDKAVKWYYANHDDVSDYWIRHFVGDCVQDAAVWMSDIVKDGWERRG